MQIFTYLQGSSKFLIINYSKFTFHHLTDDIIVGGKLAYKNGAIQVPDAPGLGVELDRDKLDQYAQP
ncbi:enolase C-terminal domain-like protein [Paenibacillus cremeus]|uniref:Enolase C-terminal domain-containing protein n=1 Tax=Paenibacillus cremeus TaxID=2163881 RepID=A0A559KFL5_9BACL|nr:enolase C-terminal domain-like protein [Paenibacillus cremeus]TVY10924.1 hypothetical protein FPZ49_05450 [Paenibacillus cremeus]